ncbi:ABC transporter permease [Nocardioides insulae]|uniref:ABC transporter permease n=1 Tax=Nocardioides insulae TaxID=394734 RepID=UPI00048F804A|nr:ABC transporter permease subunit [Nocardioides insulae]
MRPTAVYASRFLVLVAIAAVWELGSRTGLLDPMTWSRPSLFIPQFFDLFGLTEVRVDLRSTLINIGLGFGIGALCGGFIGFLLTALPSMTRNVFLGYLASVQAVPLLIFYPLLLTIFGLTRAPIVLIVSVVVTVPVAMSVANGLLSVPVSLDRLAKSLQMSRAAAFRKVHFPAAVPHIFPGVRLGLLAAVVSTIGMEFIVSATGLGYSVAHTYHAFAVDQMYALILLICVLAVLIDVGLTKMEKELRRDRVA